MNRRKSLQIIGGAVIGISGLVLAESKWQLLDQLGHQGFFSLKEEQLIAAIADTIIPEGIPTTGGAKDSTPIGALSTGTDKFLIRLFEHCYKGEDQTLIKMELKKLKSQGFLSADKIKREELLIAMSKSKIPSEDKFFKLMKSETIRGFSTAREVMLNYRNYQLAPGIYKGCVDINSQT